MTRTDSGLLIAAEKFLRWLQQKNMHERPLKLGYLVTTLQIQRRRLYTIIAVLDALGWISCRRSNTVCISICTAYVIRDPVTTRVRLCNTARKAREKVQELLKTGYIIINNNSRVEYDVRAVLHGLGVCMYNTAVRQTVLNPLFRTSLDVFVC